MSLRTRSSETAAVYPSQLFGGPGKDRLALSETVVQVYICISLLGGLAGCALAGYFAFWKPLLGAFLVP